MRTTVPGEMLVAFRGWSWEGEGAGGRGVGEATQGDWILPERCRIALGPQSKSESQPSTGFVIQRDLT